MNYPPIPARAGIDVIGCAEFIQPNTSRYLQNIH
jgi:hypothetical protein